MMIFHRFPTSTDAVQFLAAVERDTGDCGRLYSSSTAAQAADPFPVELTPPIVHIPRQLTPEGDIDIDREHQLEQLAARYNGTLAGT